MMEDVSYESALGVKEQIDHLKSINLAIGDQEYAEMFLNSVSYYRLIKAYGRDFKNHGEQFRKGVTFEQIAGVYRFNDYIRGLLIPPLEGIEISLRCKIANQFCTNYGVFKYDSKDCFEVSTPEEESDFLELQGKIKQTIINGADNPIVQHFNKWHHGKIPLYALVEILSFGVLVKFYKIMKKEDRQAIAGLHGLDEFHFGTWLPCFLELRNRCAHYDRIYGKKFKKSPKLLSCDKKWVTEYNTLFPILICMSRIFKGDSGWESAMQSFRILLEQYGDIIKKEKMGFPEDWYEVLIDPDFDPDSVLYKALERAGALLKKSETLQ